MRVLGVLAVSLALVLPLSGCIASLVPAGIPMARLPPDWSLSGESTTGTAGSGPFTVQYRMNVYVRTSDPPAKIYVTTVPDVPLYDEAGAMRQEVKARLNSEGVVETPRGSGSTTIEGNSAQFQFYDLELTIRGTSVRGKAVQATWTCGSTGNFVGVYGYAATQVPRPVLGTVENESAWRQVVGEGGDNSVGGLVAAVACRV